MSLDNRVMSGTWGEVWVDGELWAELSGAQAKYSYSKSKISMCGNMVQGNKVTGVSGSGTLSVHKMYTRNRKRSDSILEGKDVRATVIIKLDDPDAFGAERVALYDVSFEDETIADFTAGEPAKVSYPFTFGRREWLDTVEPT